LSWPTGELDRVTAGTLNIGNANSGTITVISDVTRAASTNVALTSNGDVVFSGGQVNTGGGTLLLDSGNSPAAVKPTRSGIDVTASTLSFGSDLAIAINGTTVDTQYHQLNVAGIVNITGVSLVLSGSHSPSGGQQFIIVNNDGSDAITGNFTLAGGGNRRQWRLARRRRYDHKLPGIGFERDHHLPGRLWQRCRLDGRSAPST
jgi:hypothetical protein